MPEDAAAAGGAWTVDEATAAFLVSQAGRDLLAEVGGLPGDGPSRVLALRKRGLNAPVAGAAVSTAEARIRARARFPDADRLFFTPDALAQATSPGLAAYHAERLASFRASGLAALEKEIALTAT